MENIELGAVITVDGMPDWLRDDETVAGQWRNHSWFSGGTTTKSCYSSPDEITAIRLPADHPYYLATSNGFTYWPGGESAPVDWDGGEVLYGGGLPAKFHGFWKRDDPVDGVEVIGYRRKAEPVVNEAWPDAFKSGTITVSQITRAEAYEDGLDIATLERLGLLKEETLLERFEREHGGLDNNQRDIVAAYQKWVAGV